MGQATRTMRLIATRGVRGLLAEWNLVAGNGWEHRYPTTPAGANVHTSTDKGRVVTGALFSAASSRASVDTRNTNITVDAWLRGTVLANPCILIAAEQSGGYNGFWVRGSVTPGKLSWFANGGFYDNVGSVIPNDGRLHHVALSIRGPFGTATTVAPFLNGVPGTTQNTGFSRLPSGPTTPQPLYVGAPPSAGGTPAWPGIAVVRLWGRALSDAEIRILHQRGPNSAATAPALRGSVGIASHAYYYRNFVSSRGLR